jgi:hypothetical protein
VVYRNSKVGTRGKKIEFSNNSRNAELTRRVHVFRFPTGDRERKYRSTRKKKKMHNTTGGGCVNRWTRD